MLFKFNFRLYIWFVRAKSLWQCAYFIEFGFKAIQHPCVQWFFKNIIVGIKARFIIVQCWMQIKRSTESKIASLYVCCWTKILSPVIISELMHMYAPVCQFTKLAWNGIYSRSFHVLNELSPVLFCAYFDTLLSNPNAAGMGCHIGSHLLARSFTLTTWFCWHLVRTPCVVCCEFAMSTPQSLMSCLLPANLSVMLPPNGTTKHAAQDACLCSPLFLIGSQLIAFVGKWPHLGHIKRIIAWIRTTYLQTI